LICFANVALFELCAVNEPKADGYDAGGDKDDGGERFSEEEPARERGENGAQYAHEREEGGCEAFQHLAVDIVADNI